MTSDPMSPFDSADPLWRALAEEASDGLFLSDTSLRVVWVNRRGCELLGREFADIVGNSVSHFFWSPGELEREPLHSGELLAGRDTMTERAFRTKSGERRVLEVSARSVGNGLILGIARDATARLDVLDRLKRSEASFRAVIEQSPDGIVVHVDRIAVYANRALATMLGFDSPEDLVGTRIIDLVHPDDRPQVTGRVRELQTGMPTVPFNEERLMRRDGSVLIASISGVSIVYEGKPAIAALVRDVTEQRSMLAQLAHSEKMASLGVLSAGVAHEVNNPLAYLMLRLRAMTTVGDKLASAVDRTRQRLVARVGPEAAAEILDPDLGSESFALLTDHVATASEGAERVRTIVEDLRIFSRSDQDAVRPLDVREPLARALSMVGHHLSDSARVILEERGETPLVLATEGRLTQVFVNLLLNAGHAMAEAEGRSHEVRVLVASEHGEVLVSIEDSGEGIAPENLPRVFEPFFTTKPVGIGTGLGLSICHGIVLALGGTIRVESRVGVGSKFTVVIPPAPRD